jgi:Flp pilus assembly protein TadB
MKNNDFEKNFTDYINSLDEKDGRIGENIHLWSEFSERLENRKSTSGRRWAAPAFAALSFCAIMIFFSVFSSYKPAATGISGSGINAAAQESGDNAELDAYYQISMDM